MACCAKGDQERSAKKKNVWRLGKKASASRDGGLFSYDARYDFSESLFRGGRNVLVPSDSNI